MGSDSGLWFTPNSSGHGRDGPWKEIETVLKWSY
jgi:hypothetical protein